MNYETIQFMLSELKHQTMELTEEYIDYKDLNFKDFNAGFCLAIGAVKELFSKENCEKIEQELKLENK